MPQTRCSLNANERAKPVPELHQSGKKRIPVMGARIARPREGTRGHAATFKHTEAESTRRSARAASSSSLFAFTLGATFCDTSHLGSNSARCK